jgi:hypothetical protein
MLVWVVISTSSAQERTSYFFRHTDFILPSASFSFERLLNTLNWSGVVRTDMQSGIWSVHLDQQYRTRSIRGFQLSHQDEYGGTVDAAVRLLDELSAKMTVTSQSTSDDRARELGKTSMQRVLAGVEYALTENVRAGILGGYEWNRQSDQQDAGTAYALRLEGRNITWDEFTIDASGQWAESLLDRRRPSDGDARIVFWREFSPGTDDSLTIDYSTQQRSFYFAASPDVQNAFDVSQNIFERRAEGWGIQNRLRYRMSDDLRMVVDAGMSTRTIDRGNRYRVFGSAPVMADATVQELLLSGSALLEWKVSENISLLGSLAHQSREERHLTRSFADLAPEVLAQQEALARRLENIASRTAAWVGGDVKLSTSNRLHVRASASILRYDTPDTLNTDDRDELYLTLHAEDVQHLGASMRLLVGLDLSASHLVYLSRFQSANNAWNRVIRLSAQVFAQPTKSIENVLRAEVIGNYTASDYEEQVASVRSFSFRQAAWYDSLSIRLSSRIVALASAGVRTSERGALRWREFTERPEDEMTEIHVWPRLALMAYPFRFTVGYRYFVQDRYSFKEQKRVFQRSYSSRGPAASIDWTGDTAYAVVLEGWHETQITSGQSVASVPNLAVNIRLPI